MKIRIGKAKEEKGIGEFEKILEACANLIAPKQDTDLGKKIPDDFFKNYNDFCKKMEAACESRIKTSLRGLISKSNPYLKKLKEYCQNLQKIDVDNLNAKHISEIKAKTSEDFLKDYKNFLNEFNPTIVKFESCIGNFTKEIDDIMKFSEKYEDKDDSIPILAYNEITKPLEKMKKSLENLPELLKKDKSDQRSKILNEFLEKEEKAKEAEKKKQQQQEEENKRKQEEEKKYTDFLEELKKECTAKCEITKDAQDKQDINLQSKVMKFIVALAFKNAYKQTSKLSNVLAYIGTNYSSFNTICSRLKTAYKIPGTAKDTFQKNVAQKIKSLKSGIDKYNDKELQDLFISLADFLKKDLKKDDSKSDPVFSETQIKEMLKVLKDGIDTIEKETTKITGLW